MEPGDALTVDDFSCSCCYEIMVDPTTLNCGHNVCRFCLAQWWKSSSQTSCPECRHVWPGFPKINITLRRTIQRLFKDQLEGRQKSLLQNPNYADVILQFEEFGKTRLQNSTSTPARRGNYFYTICAITMAIAVMLTLMLRPFWGGSYSELSTKLVHEWTSDDVQSWVGGLGNWAKSTYDVRFKEAEIDGNLLMKMTEQDLISPPIKMKIQLQRRVFMSALQILLAQGLKPPDDFFEYKAANRALSMMLLFGLREFPRATTTYLYFFHYKELFLPFIHHTCPPPKTHPLSSSDMTSLSEPPTWSQQTTFLTRLIICPYYLLASFAYDYLDVNYWTARIVILHAVLMTLYEFSNVKWLLMSGFRAIPMIAIKCMLFAFGNAAFHKIIWPIIPFFICDCVFYWMLYISPFDALNRSWRRFNTQPQHPQNQIQENNNDNQRRQGGGWHMNFEWNLQGPR